jgi:putative hydrolase of the HAD superfamily
MSEIIRCQFWDVGGVLLTNGWDRVERGRAVERFHLDGQDFERRHAAIADALDRGRIGLDAYLQETVFYAPRRFSRDEFRTFMCEQSQPNSETISIVGGLARSRRYLMATLNNESLELNRYRIDTFRLRESFDAFLSSCYLGLAKPDPAIYRLALQLTGRSAEECVVIDDREDNLAAARELGMRTISYRDPAQLREELRRAGVLESRGVHS